MFLFFAPKHPSEHIPTTMQNSLQSSSLPDIVTRHLFTSSSKRRDCSSSLWLTIFTILLAFVAIVPTANAFVIPADASTIVSGSILRRSSPYIIQSLPPSVPTEALHVLVPRDRFLVANLTSGLEVLDPVTRQAILQGPGTDGSGENFDAPALLWISFGFLVGLPLALVGIRGWWVTTGIGLGLAGLVASWAAIINSVGVPGVSDLILSAIVLSFFCLCFICGAFPYGRIAGMVCITITGGISLGIRICILRGGLLFSGDNIYSVNWIIIALFGIVSVLSLIWSNYRRSALLFGCTASGTFMAGLAGDLVANKQDGMSRGLRLLFDRNASHYLDIIVGGYNPPISTQIIIGVSIVLIPILSYGQHRIFSGPFDRTSDGNDMESIPEVPAEKAGDSPTQKDKPFAKTTPKPGHSSVAAQPQGGMTSYRNR